MPKRNIAELLGSGEPIESILSTLRQKDITVPVWGGVKGLESEFNPVRHPVMDSHIYPDIVHADGIEQVTRITCDLQRLATKRMTELVCGVPVKRVYSSENDRQKEAAAFIESVFQRNRIDSLNIERCNMLFAGCEVLTLWYAVLEDNVIYGRKSSLKMRCRNFSPMTGDNLYPYFDDFGDLKAMSVEYTRNNGRKSVHFFDTYTADRHIRWSTENDTGTWAVDTDEVIALGKIPAVYVYRPTPIWEDTSKTVYEIEWALSRNGNYLRKNSKPLFVVFADEAISYGDEKSENSEFRAVMQYPKGSTAQYITWSQAVENLKFYVEQLRSMFFTQLQLPDWSYEKMSQIALSGESRKQMFIDAQLKVKDESGRLIEFFDREVNVVKAFAKAALGEAYAADIDALQVETQITPFSIDDEKDTISNLMLANGNRPIISQREAIEQLGWSSDPDSTLEEIRQQEQADTMELAQ